MPRLRGISLAPQYAIPFHPINVEEHVAPPVRIPSGENWKCFEVGTKDFLLKCWVYFSFSFVFVWAGHSLWNLIFEVSVLRNGPPVLRRTRPTSSCSVSPRDKTKKYISLYFYGLLPNSLLLSVTLTAPRFQGTSQAMVVPCSSTIYILYSNQRVGLR